MAKQCTLGDFSWIIEEDWLIGHQNSVLVLSKKTLIYYRWEKVIKAIFCMKNSFHLTMGTILKSNKAYTPLLCRLTVNGRPPSRFFKVAPISVFNIFLAQFFGHLDILDIFLRFWTLPRGFGAGLSGKTSRMVFSRSGLRSWFSRLFRKKVDTQSIYISRQGF